MSQQVATVSHQAPPFWRDLRFLSIAGQVLFVLIVALIAGTLYANVTSGMASLGMNAGYGFMGLAAGFEISQTPIPYNPIDSYWRAFQVGVINTILVSLVGIALATILGIVVGVAQLSTNWLVARLARTYVAIFRNIPLLLQLFFWYFGVFQQLPVVRESIALPGAIYLSSRGLAFPWLEPRLIQQPAGEPTSNVMLWLTVVLASIVVAGAAWYVLKVRQDRTGAQSPRFLIAALIIAASGVLGLMVLQPFVLTVPEFQRFNFQGGQRISIEYAALLLGLTTYTGAFIAEHVRAGIQGIPKGQNEAARAVGLKGGQMMRLVILPQALRIIIPPTTNEYLNLTKNSSLAIAIAYPDLFNVSRTILNQTGQAVSVIGLIMVSYLTISLVTSLLMNLYNRRVRLVER
ncbi:MAG: ABC transporter permease subunit [Chloroflexaceae bacterium]|nr:ABC transporter permease subunit [Chloroflexaceae bacterium]